MHLTTPVVRGTKAEIVVWTKNALASAESSRMAHVAGFGTLARPDFAELLVFAAAPRAITSAK
ncbi:hypothetical protein SPRG_13058 [Saprolegnia parasitica CBS 223.65]|uniref:Uncharacterized protein n=1 Tax=Saprolegnia parasitica (strain CBS 223.65) TaxID=695850 RepID=A0A067BZD8_SAPPC|nr:hypothetical protein SPRG_13058 [Saprolegnia parasitica CBS 223.65]KDO19952.1 hypothetical protein SPRG_13058 [Saprolegnia parasitica CBS 223.65]|eukprot:XP_012209323.1 hypothetical protein SPRG_13058 [Saprolegnia parasitica CBS 223.65]